MQSFRLSLEVFPHLYGSNQVLEVKDLKGSHSGKMSDIGVLKLKFRVHNKFEIALSQNYRG